MNPVLSSAVRAALGVREDPNPLRDGQLDTFDKLIVVPVRPGHPREPGPQRFSVDQDLGVCYVREADWPKLRETLRARRAKANIAIDVQADEIVARVQR